MGGEGGEETKSNGSACCFLQCHKQVGTINHFDSSCTMEYFFQVVSGKQREWSCNPVITLLRSETGNSVKFSDVAKFTSTVSAMNVLPDGLSR